MNGTVSYLFGYLVGAYLTLWAVERGSFTWWQPLLLAAAVVFADAVARLAVGLIFQRRDCKARTK